MLVHEVSASVTSLGRGSDATLQLLLDGGAQTQQRSTMSVGARWTATVKDADGNVIGLIQSP